ncbi:MAG: DUF6285 domain-containing protein [Burkholderiales bacterium]
MQDAPTPPQILEGIARFLRDTVVPQLKGAAQYDARIAASLLQIVQRQLDHGEPAEASELASLRALLNADDGDLPQLNRRLCERIASGGFALDDPQLLNHLWATTLAKMAVDQPGYSTYERVSKAP